jgi:hypothetical protein
MRTSKHHAPSMRWNESWYRPDTIGCSGNDGVCWQTTKYDRAVAVPAASSTAMITLLAMCLVRRVPVSSCTRLVLR